MGRTYLVVTFGVGLGALNTGNNLLYLVLGLLLAMVVASGVLSERCLRYLSSAGWAPSPPSRVSPSPSAGPSPAAWATPSRSR